MEMMVQCSVCMGEGSREDITESKPCDMCIEDGYLFDVECDICSGAGCARCEGTGILDMVECPRCDMGQILYHPKCRNCNGEGWVPNPVFDVEE